MDDLDPLDLDVFQLRRAALHLHGTSEDESEVTRVCLQSENLGSEQVVAPFSHLDSDSDAISTSRLLAERMASVEAETIYDFILKNCRAMHAVPLAGNSYSVDGLVCGDLESVYDDVGRGWNRFRERYPNSNGIIQFSRVGLNAAKSQAVICFGAQHDRLMGYGKYILFQKQDVDWVKSQEIRAWIS